MNGSAKAGSVTFLLDRIMAGDHEAVESLWQRYFPRLVGLARKKLQGVARRVTDEEDVALSAFDSFCRRAEQGNFPNLKDRDSLWALLVVLTARKCTDLIKHHTRGKRGAGQVHGDSALHVGDSADHPNSFDGLQGDDPTPEVAAILAEEVETLLARLPDSPLRQVAIWKLEGFTNSEIAEKQHCSEPTIERRLALIRRLLKPS